MSAASSRTARFVTVLAQPSSSGGHQVEEGEDRHPGQVDEVPVKSKHLDRPGPRAPERDGEQTDDACRDVQAVIAGQRVERASVEAAVDPHWIDGHPAPPILGALAPEKSQTQTG